MSGERYRLTWASSFSSLFQTANNNNVGQYSILIAGADLGFQARGGTLKKIAPSGGRRENIWGISCEKSQFYAKKIIFFSNFRGGARRVCPPPLDLPLYSYIKHNIHSFFYPYVKVTWQASTLTYFLTCSFGQLTKKSTCPTQSFSCPKKLVKITKARE